MIVWKGPGVLNSIDSRLPLAFLFIVSGVIICYMGKTLNCKSGKVQVDADTGERYQTGVGKGKALE